jgi:hypothetical protein
MDLLLLTEAVQSSNLTKSPKEEAPNQEEGFVGGTQQDD